MHATMNRCEHEATATTVKEALEPELSESGLGGIFHYYGVNRSPTVTLTLVPRSVADAACVLPHGTKRPQGQAPVPASFMSGARAIIYKTIPCIVISVNDVCSVTVSFRPACENPESSNPSDAIYKYNDRILAPIVCKSTRSLVTAITKHYMFGLAPATRTAQTSLHLALEALTQAHKHVTDAVATLDAFEPSQRQRKRDVEKLKRKKQLKLAKTESGGVMKPRKDVAPLDPSTALVDEAYAIAYSNDEDTEDSDDIEDVDLDDIDPDDLDTTTTDDTSITLDEEAA
jgi:hypothetical protein